MAEVLLAPAPPPPSSVPLSHATALGALAAAGVLLFVLWDAVGLIITMAHEGAHAVVGLFFGHSIGEMTIEPTREGGTMVGPPGGFFVTLAGYLGPSAFGLLDAAMLVKGRPDAVLWINLFLLALLLTRVRSVFAAFVVVAAGGVLYLAAAYGTPLAQLGVACAWTWILLIGGTVRIAEVRWRGQDFRELSGMTFGLVPSIVWTTVALAGAVGALALGGGWLTGTVQPGF
jgi:peptidase M50B-like protein